MDNNKTPKIRFKGFTDPWEQRKLGEVLETVTDYVAAGSFADLAKNVEYKDYPDYAQLVRTMDLKNGFTSAQEVYVNKNAFDYLYRVNMDKECIILPNIGNCGEVYYVKPENLPYEHNVLGPNAIFVRSETCANNFLSILFQAKDFQTKLKLIVSPNGQTKFNKTELKGIDLILPGDVNEQEQIGTYFSNLDNLITLHQRKYNKLLNVKKSMLEKMFPKNGSNIPEIRFKGFTDPWEQRKWIDTVDISTEMVDPTSGEFDDMPHIAPGNIESFTGRIFDNVKSVKEEQLISGKFRFRPGDVVYGKINPQLGKYFYASVDGLTSADAYVFNGKNGISQKFLFSLLQTADFFKYSVSVSKRSGMPKINRDELNAYSFLAPNAEEQNKIGDFLLELDHLITLHQRELEKLQNIKKSMLEKMFV